MKVSFKFDKPESQIIEETVGRDQIQLFMANQARTLMAPYVPELNHILVKNVRTYVENGQGIVHYLSPCARFQYHGKLMVSSTTGSAWSHGEYKVLTSIELNYSKPMASSYWDKAMMTARGADLARAVQNFIKQKGG